MIDKAVKAGAKLISLKEFMEIRKKINEVQE
jgi:hypothetical protein